MVDYRSKSFSSDGEVQIERYYGGPRPNLSEPHEFRSYSVSYASPYAPPPTTTNTQMDVVGKEFKFKKGKSTNGSTSKSWNFNDPEYQRKRRVASYKVYAVEGKVKGSFKKSFRWLKDKYTNVVYGWCFESGHSNAPFLSTRRPTGLELCRANSRGALCDTRNRILFSWEQSPGEPKEMGDCDTPDIPIPPPKPPPGRQTPPKELIRNENNYDGDNDDDSFPDVVDTFSLSAAIDMVKLEERQKHNMLGGVSIDPDGSQSPSFIFQRFLLDAEALAILSDFPIFKNINYNREKCMPQTSTPKGCGLEVFFPWRMMKHKPRGVKSPVSVTSMSEKVKPQWGMRKKHKSSLAERSSRRGV